MFAITENKLSPTLRQGRIYKYRNKNIFLNIFLSIRHIYIYLTNLKVETKKDKLSGTREKKTNVICFFIPLICINFAHQYII